MCKMIARNKRKLRSLRRVAALLMSCMMALAQMPLTVLASEGASALTEGGTYYFDLSGAGLPGTVSGSLPDAALNYVPFTYTAHADNGEGGTYPQFTAAKAVTGGAGQSELESAGLIGGKDYTYGGAAYKLQASDTGDGLTPLLKPAGSVSLRTVTLHLNGKSFHGSENLLLAAGAGAAFTAPDKPGSITDDFYGWNTSADGSGEAYAAADSVPAGVDTLYAQWSEPAPNAGDPDGNEKEANTTDDTATLEDTSAANNELSETRGNNRAATGRAGLIPTEDGRSGSSAGHPNNTTAIYAEGLELKLVASTEKEGYTHIFYRRLGSGADYSPYYPSYIPGGSPETGYNLSNISICGDSKEASSTGDSIKINMEGGTVNSIQGCKTSTTPVTITRIEINITGGTVIEDVSGNSSNSVTGGIDITIKDATVNGAICANIGANNVKGGTNITVENSKIGGTIIGGSKRGTLSGNTNITIAGGSTVGGSVYGSNTDGGSLTGDTGVTIAGGSTVSGDVYGGGNGGILEGSTNVTITGGSTVAQNVYGGGSGNNKVTKNTQVVVTGGSTVHGSVYGGGRFSSVQDIATVRIDNEGGTVDGSIYGGGYEFQGSVSETEVTVTGGTVTGSVYGGGYRGDVTGENGTTVAITGGTINTNVFGGGSLNGTDGKVTGSAKVTVTGGSIKGNLFGGGDSASKAGTGTGSSTVTVGGSAKIGDNLMGICLNGVDIKNGVDNFTFAPDTPLTNDSKIFVVLPSDFVKDTVIATGARQGDETHLFLTGNGAGKLATQFNADENSITVFDPRGIVPDVEGKNIYANGTELLLEQGEDDTKTIVSFRPAGSEEHTPYYLLDVSGATGNTETGYDLSSYMVYGGSKDADLSGDTTITMNGGKVKYLYGGGMAAVTGNTKVTMEGGKVEAIYGGSNGKKIDGDTYVTITGGKVTDTVYGGGYGFNYDAAVTGDTHVTVTGGTLQSVFGGGAFSDVNGSTNVIIDANAPTDGTANVSTLNGGNHGNGLSGGTVGATNIQMKNGKITNIYGGGSTKKTTVSGKVSITVSGGEVKTIRGGGTDDTIGSIEIAVNDGQINSLYGGGFGASTISGGIEITVNGGKITGSLYGGGYGSNTGSNTITGGVKVTVADSASVASLYGNCYSKGTIDNTTLHITGGTVTNVYGGGGSATESAAIHITGGVVTKSVTAAGDSITIGRNAQIGGVTDFGASFGINIKSDRIQTGADSFSIESPLTGDDGCVYVSLPEDIAEDAVIATGDANVLEASLAKLTLIGGGAADKKLIQDGDVLKLTSSIVTPTVDSNNNPKAIYANGLDLKLTAGVVDGHTKVFYRPMDADTEAYTLLAITGADGSLDNGYDLSGWTVYGGGSNNDSDPIGKTQVTMEGGTVNTIYGGGFEKTVDGDTTVTLTGGAVTNVYGGGKEGSVTGTRTVAVGSSAKVGNNNGAGIFLNGNSGTGEIKNGVDSFTISSQLTGDDGSIYLVLPENIAAGIVIASDTSGAAEANLAKLSLTGAGKMDKQLAADADGNIKLISSYAVTPTVGGLNNKDIYANGAELKLVEGADPDKTKLYYRPMGSENDYVLFKVAGATGSYYDGYDLSGYSIFGGNGDTELTGDTKITMTGGTVNQLCGGGLQKTNGSSTVSIEGGTINSNVFGSSQYSPLTGDVSVNITGGTIKRDVQGGYKIDGTISVDITGGTVVGNVYGGSSGAPDNPGALTIGGDAKIGGIDSDGYNHGIKLNGSGCADGVNQFVIDGPLSDTAYVSIVVPNNVGAGKVIASGASESDLTKLGLLGNNAVNLKMTLEDGNIILAANDVITPTIVGKNLYANGTDLKLEEGTTAGTTKVYYRPIDSADGDAYQIYEIPKAIGSTEAGYDLKDYAIFGGGWLINSVNTKITMNGGTVNTLYGGGSNADVTGDAGTSIIIHGGTVCDSIYGGGSKGTVNGNTNVTVNGGIVKDSVYGGGRVLDSPVNGTAYVTVNGGEVSDTVYGGGIYSSVSNAVVTVTDGTVGTIYGGSNGYTGTNVIDAMVTVSGGTVTGNVYGSGQSSDAGSVTVSISGTVKGSVYSSTKNSKVNTATVTVSGNAQIGDAGGNGIILNSTTVTAAPVLNGVKEFTIEAPLTNNAKVYVVPPADAEAGTAITTNASPSDLSKLALTGNTAGLTLAYHIDKSIRLADSNAVTPTVFYLNILANGNDILLEKGEDDSKTKVYYRPAGSTEFSAYTLFEVSNAIGTAENGYKLSEYKIFGHNVTTANTVITMNGGSVARIYGGRYDSTVSVNNKTDIVINGGTVRDFVFGGGHQDTIDTETNITLSGGTVDYIYGGSESGTINGQTKVTVTGGTVNCDIYGGGYRGSVSNGTNITITGGAIIGNVFGGGENSSTNGAKALTVGVGAKIGASGTGIVVNGGDITNGIDSFTISPQLTGDDGSVYVVLPENYPGGTIATGTADDLTKLALTGAGADDQTLTFDNGNIIAKKIVLSDDAALSALSYTIDGQTTDVPGFTADTVQYQIELPYGTSPEAVITLNGTVNHSGASITSNAGVTLSEGSVTATLTVTAEDGTTTKEYSISFTIASSPEPVVTGVTILPAEVQIEKGDTQQFAATVIGSNNPAQTVTWTLEGSHTDGTSLSDTGLLTIAANETAKTLTVRATSTANAGVSGTANVTVTDKPVIDDNNDGDKGNGDKNTAGKNNKRPGAAAPTGDTNTPWTLLLLSAAIVSALCLKRKRYW